MPNIYAIRENFAGWLRRLANRISPELPPPPIKAVEGTLSKLSVAIAEPSAIETRCALLLRKQLLSNLFKELEKSDYVRINRRDDVHPSIIVYEASLLVANPPQI